MPDVTRPTKAEICAAIQTALTAALGVAEPWGNDWATGALAGLAWLAKEAEDGGDVLGTILSDAGGVARVALHGTAGYRHTATLEDLYWRWFLTEPETPPVCPCGLCARQWRAREAELAIERSAAVAP
jgi:hypothetical protein